jgi:hypothetical protein
MKGNAYTALGWLVWLVGKRVVARKLQQTKVRVAAAALVALVVAAGVAAAARSGDEE